MSRSFTTPLFSLVAVLILAGQMPESDVDVMHRIMTLSAGLSLTGVDEAEAKRRFAQFDRLSNQIYSEIDHWIAAQFTPAHESRSIQERLRIVLEGHKPNPEYADLAFAQSTSLRAGQSLLVAFTVVRGPHNDVATIRGYRWNGRQFELVGTAGGDFDDYSMFKTPLSSPIAGESWLLAWGQASTFNGRKVRFRIYAFDGAEFRTVWSPEDMLDARIELSARGFVITSRGPDDVARITTEYFLTASGPVKTR